MVGALIVGHTVTMWFYVVCARHGSKLAFRLSEFIEPLPFRDFVLVLAGLETSRSGLALLGLCKRQPRSVYCASVLPSVFT